MEILVVGVSIVAFAVIALSLLAKGPAIDNSPLALKRMTARFEGRGPLRIAWIGRSSAEIEYGGLPWQMSFAKPAMPADRSIQPTVSTGDPAFDFAVDVRGDPDDVIALLDATTRRMIADFVAANGQLGWGRLRHQVTGAPEAIEGAAERALALGERLARPSRKKLLLEIVRTDPIPAVRESALRLLVAKFAGTRELEEATAAALDDRRPEIALLGASVSKSERARKVLRGLVADARIDAGLRAQALERVGTDRELVGLALGQPDWRLRKAAVRLAQASEIEKLIQLAREEPAELAEAVAVALGKLGAGEDALISLLARPEDSVRNAAAEALGMVGTVRAVEPLLPLAKHLAAARDAVRRIQERLGDADAGRLSLSEGQGGELSVAHEAGRLSQVKS